MHDGSDQLGEFECLLDEVLRWPLFGVEAEKAEFLGAIEDHDEVALADADRANLMARELPLDMYPEMRGGELLLGERERPVHGVSQVGVG